MLGRRRSNTFAMGEGPSNWDLAKETYHEYKWSLGPCSTAPYRLDAGFPPGFQTYLLFNPIVYFSGSITSATSLPSGPMGLNDRRRRFHGPSNLAASFGPCFARVVPCARPRKTVRGQSRRGGRDLRPSGFPMNASSEVGHELFPT